LNKSLKTVNDKQINTIIGVFVFFLLALCLSLRNYLTESLVLSSLAFIILRIYLKNFGSSDAKVCQVSNEDLSLLLSQNGENQSKILRVTSIFNENAKDMLNYLTNIKTIREWNIYLKNINDFRREDNSAKYIYSKDLRTEEGDFELKIKRKINSSNNPIIIIDTLETENSPGLRMRLITIEASETSEKTKVSIYLTLKNVIDGKTPHTYLKSNLNCLDLLHHFINNRNFANPSKEKGKDLSILVPPTETSSKLEAKPETIVIEKENNLENQEPRQSIASKLVNTNKQPEKIPDFHELSNRFSEARREDLTFNPEDNEIILKEKTSKPSPFDAQPTETIKVSQENIDPVIAKENDEIISVCQQKYSELDKILGKQWKVLEDKKEYIIYYFDEPSGLRSVRSEVTIEKNIKTVWDTLMDINLKSKFDKNFDCGHNIREIDNDHVLTYLKYKGKFLISPRDFTIVTYKKYVIYF
jgi:hypothetical protein